MLSPGHPLPRTVLNHAHVIRASFVVSDYLCSSSYNAATALQSGWFKSDPTMSRHLIEPEILDRWEMVRAAMWEGPATANTFGLTPERQ